MSGIFHFLSQVTGNAYRDTFIVRLGVGLLLSQFGITGFLGNVLGFFLRGVLGLFMQRGIFTIDVLLDAYREGQKLKEFEAEARAAYDKAIAKVYTEEQKNEIRLQYINIIKRIGIVGNGPRH